MRSAGWRRGFRRRAVWCCQNKRTRSANPRPHWSRLIAVTSTRPGTARASRSTSSPGPRVAGTRPLRLSVPKDPEVARGKWPDNPHYRPLGAWGSTPTTIRGTRFDRGSSRPATSPALAESRAKGDWGTEAQEFRLQVHGRPLAGQHVHASLEETESSPGLLMV